jgi:riboflavin synthase
MFTGIIESLGSIARIERTAGDARITIVTDLDLSKDSVGDSVSVNGICLTITSLTGNSFVVDVSEESISRTTFDDIRVGDKVNLERALRLSDRLGGHIVTGHIDGVGVVRNRNPRGKSVVFDVTAPPGIERYMVDKGSIAVDGISLTINSCQGRDFSVNIIPHSLEVTTLGFRKAGDRVNIEADILGKYIERITAGGGTGQSKEMDLDFLANHGFLKNG